MSAAVFRYVPAMGEEGKKGPPKPTPARFALAANLRDLMAEYRLGFLTGVNAPQLEQGCGVSAKTILRMLDPYSDVSPRLDNIDTLASFFKLPTWELLKPRDRQPAVSGKEKQTPARPAASVTAAQHKEKDKKQKTR